MRETKKMQHVHLVMLVHAFDYLMTMEQRRWVIRNMPEAYNSLVGHPVAKVSWPQPTTERGEDETNETN